MNRESLTIGVARDQLIVEGVPTDPDNPLLRELASRLHRHQISVIRVPSQHPAEELEDFLETISAEANRQEMPFGLRPREELERWKTIEVEPFTFEHLQIGEGGEARPAQSRSAQTLVRARLRGAPAGPRHRRGRSGCRPDRACHQRPRP